MLGQCLRRWPKMLGQRLRHWPNNYVIDAPRAFSGRGGLLSEGQGSDELCQVKRHQLFTIQVSSYSRLALQSRDVSVDSQRLSHISIITGHKQRVYLA